MARPRSEDKRNAILAAATKVIAEQGTSAPTARIAREAGVAEGTLFTYFGDKDELLNQLYRELKGSLGLAMLEDYPRGADAKARAHHVWARYVAWGVAHPQDRLAMRQLGVSERIAPETRAAVTATFVEVNALLHEIAGTDSEETLAFKASLLGAMAEATMDFIAAHPRKRRSFSDTGFAAFWRTLHSG
ncbi:TetR/AcrR family transcriptional regulator [Pseudoxanthomonas putridarboris]|uniref:TetR/AcrR family transcriptional regulator n=1 Tax=Pseudoxanthomonas putridarboris TaxID=752605 RepID=A0ABU9J1P8_9GAMM